MTASFARHFLVLWLLSSSFAHADDSGSVVTGSHLFTYRAPAGWTVLTAPNAPYPAARDMKNGEVKGMITVDSDTKAGSLEEYCANSVAKNRVQFSQYTAHISEPEPFETAAGVKGFRVTTTLTAGTANLHYLMYYFGGSSNAKIVVSCCSPEQDAAHYLPLYDAAMKTFEPR